MTTTIGSLDLNTFNDLYSDSNQYFWFESNASATYGAGVHITLSPDTSFIANPTGQNILMNTDGISIRNGLLPMMVLDNNSLDFNVVDTTAGTYVKTASFSSTGAQIGQSGGAHSVIDANGQKFFADDGQTLLARFGKSSENGKTSIREVQAVKSNSLLYNMGYSIDANESMSVTTNTGVSLSFTITQYQSVSVDSSATNYSYLVFTYFTQDTIYDYSLSSNDSTYHANGAFSANGGIAYGSNSHAINEGTACGYNSHAQGRGTVALGTNQCVIGRYNNTAPYTKTGTTISKLFHPFVIGNGSDDSSRSNALTVDWDGNVDISGQYKISGAQIGSVMRLKGSSYSSPLGTSYKTLNLSTTAEINTGNAFTAASNGIKCAYAGTVHLIGKVRFNDGFTANDYMVAQIYNTTQSTAIQTGRMRTPTQVFNGDVWVNAYARVNANDVLLLRAENATGGRGTVTIGECSLTACYISA